LVDRIYVYGGGKYRPAKSVCSDVMMLALVFVGLVSAGLVNVTGDHFTIYITGRP